MNASNVRLEALRPSGIRAYTAMAAEVPGCVMLTLGEPDFDTPAPVREAVTRALAENRTHYAPNRGVPALVKAIAQRENCKESQIVVTVGATGALFTALLGILNAGDEVVIPTPAFPLYESIVTIAGARPVFLNTKKDDFQITKAALDACISPKTRAIILNSPNNPTGAVLSESSLSAVKETALERNLFVICDNVYQGLCAIPCPDLSRDEGLQDRILLCQSFSKPYAMTGWRAGYLKGPERVMERLLLLHAAQVASVPTFVQDACLAALGTDTSLMIAAYDRRREYACERLKDMGLTFPEPRGAFYIFPDISGTGLDDGEFCTRLIREGGVAAVPGKNFGCPGHIRISCACADETLALGMDRLKEFLRKIGENR